MMYLKYNIKSQDNRLFTLPLIIFNLLSKSHTKKKLNMINREISSLLKQFLQQPYHPWLSN